METHDFFNQREIHPQTSAIMNHTDPPTSEIVEMYLLREFGEADPNTRYPVKNFISTVLKILVGKCCEQPQGNGSFNSQLFAALQNT